MKKYKCQKCKRPAKFFDSQVSFPRDLVEAKLGKENARTLAGEVIKDKATRDFYKEYGITFKIVRLCGYHSPMRAIDQRTKKYLKATL